MEEKKKVKCHKCSYEWETDSEMVFVTCPSCRVKTKKDKETENATN